MEHKVKDIHVDYREKNIHLNMIIGITEQGLTIIINADGKYEHSIEVTKEDNYYICWECTKNKESIIDINAGVCFNSVKDFDKCIINSNYIEEQIFELHTVMFKEIIIIISEMFKQINKIESVIKR